MIVIPSEILTKKQNHILYSAGYYGNSLRVWNRLEDLHKASGRIIPRYNGAGGGTNLPKYGTPIEVDEAVFVFCEWCKLGAKPDKVFWGEEAPDTRLTIQGEVCATEQHLALYWSSEKTTMRKAMSNPLLAKSTFGLAARMILKKYLSANSYEDLNDLLEKFPDHVIEFSSYEIYLGSNPRRNTIIWEVRKY